MSIPSPTSAKPKPTARFQAPIDGIGKAKLVRYATTIQISATTSSPITTGTNQVGLPTLATDFSCGAMYCAFFRVLDFGAGMLLTCVAAT